MHVLKVKANIDNRLKAHNHLALFSEKLKEYQGEEVIIDFAEVNFIAANQFAVLSALFDDFCNCEGSGIIVRNLSPRLSSVMQKNGFGMKLGLASQVDRFHTTIPYRHFGTSEIDEFEKYLLINIFERDDIPIMTEEAKNTIIDNILEIFNNVKEHTTTEDIYSCGQFFPKSKMLYFTIADIGETIKYNVDNYIIETNNIKKENLNRICWAMKEGNSTRNNGSPGGLGFSVLSKFVTLNKGELYIVSDNECYEYYREKERYVNLDYSFRGTTVTVAINMNDNFSYLSVGNEIEQINF